MTDIALAAQSLIRSLNAPAQYHSVWIRTETEDGQFKKSLCISVRPGHEHQVRVPAEHMGFQIVNVPWPKEG